MSKNFYRKYGKRIIDLLISTIALFFISPIFISLMVFVKVKLGSPIFFVQERPGINEKIFKMYKFRTMKNYTDENGKLLSDEERLTKFGKLLRSTSLDELPELINIIKGDMSLVGPRPLLKSYLPLYNKEQKMRHTVRPGLTGYAQVNGRNSITWNEKFKYDTEYVKKYNFLLDVKIIFQTIKKVIIKDGINSDDSVTMKPFEGND